MKIDNLFKFFSDAMGRIPYSARLTRIIYALALVASCTFLCIVIFKSNIPQVLGRVGAAELFALGLCSVVYAALLALLAVGWSVMPALANPNVSRMQAIAVYGASIPSKYIPGSLLQYGSRQVLGHRLGWNAGLMARASALEVALHLVCSSSVAMLLLVPLLSAEEVGLRHHLAIAVALALGATIASLFLCRKFPPNVLLRSAVYQLLFFGGLAGVAMACGAIAGIDGRILPGVGGLFLLSWLIGFAIPAAPGGLGIREASGIALLSGLVGLEAALFLLASMRLVTVIGDFLIFLAALICQVTVRPA